MKYIVISITMPPRQQEKEPAFVMRFPFIFPDMLVHAHVAKAQCLLLDLMYPGAKSVEVTSAGSMNSMAFDGDAYGKSDTLNLKSDPSDTSLIRNCDYGGVMTVPATPQPKTERYRGFVLWREVGTDPGKASRFHVWVGERRHADRSLKKRLQSETRVGLRSLINGYVDGGER